MKVKGIAHRGYPPKYPENTLSSFQAACDLGFEILELDVHLSKDGIPVLMHDSHLDRMASVNGMIKDYTLKELKTFQVEGGETIPTLEEALRLVKGEMIVAIEMKQEGHLYSGLEEAVLQVIRKLDMLDQVYAMSFDHYSVMKMRELSSDIELGLIFAGATPAAFSFAKEINTKYLAVNIAHITKEYVHECEDRGFQLVAWVVNTEQQIKQMSHFPSVLCTTDELELFKSIYHSYGV